MKKITMILAVLALTVGAATAQKKGTSDAKTAKIIVIFFINFYFVWLIKRKLQSFVVEFQIIYTLFFLHNK